MRAAVIDMQRDFLEPGDWEMLGNDVSQLRRRLSRTNACWLRGGSGLQVLHTREASAGSDGSAAAKKIRALQTCMAMRADGANPGSRRSGHDLYLSFIAADGAVIDKPARALLRYDLHAILQNKGIRNDRHGRHY